MAARVNIGFKINAQEQTVNFFTRSKKMSNVSSAETVEMARVVSTNMTNQVRINLLF